jgi:CNT family concentrative nucleoside transporter
MSSLQSIAGIIVFSFIVYLFSRDRKKISLRFVVIGLLSQFAFAVVLLKVPFVSDLLMHINNVVGALQNATDKSAHFMLGYLAGGPTPFAVTAPENSFIVAFRVLPLILVISALSALLFHFGILTFVVDLFSKVLRRFFRISGALGFGASATVFLGTVESPLIVRPYLEKMSRSDLLALLTTSMGTIAGTVMVLYASVLGKVLPNALIHMLTASIINVPAALMLSHIFLPNTDVPDDNFTSINSGLTWIEVLLAAVEDGVKMIISIVAIIIVLFAFTYLLDGMLATFNQDWSLAAFLSQLLRPVMWLVGFEWDKASVAADLMGTKIILNEFVSYLKMSQLNIFNPRETLVMSYSLCGFANLASCGIIIAGLTAILPSRREDIVQLTFISLFLGNLTTLMTGCVINLVYLI